MTIENSWTALRSASCGAEPTSGCDRPEAIPSTLVVDSAGVTIVSMSEPEESWTLEDELELSLGTVDGAGTLGFFQIQSARFLPEGRLAVTDRGSEEVRVFSQAGDFLDRFGGSGSGPREFLGIGAILPWNDSLLVHDAGNDRVQVVASDGGTRTFRFTTAYGRVTPLGITPAGMVVGVTTRGMMELEGSGIVTDTALMASYDGEGRLSGEIGHLPFGERFVLRQGDLNTVLGSALGSRGTAALQGPDLCHAFAFQVEFRCLAPDGQLVRVMRVAIPPRPTDQQAENAWWDVMLDPAFPERERMYRRLQEYIPLPDTLPAFSGIFTDGDGRLWLQRYAVPGDPEFEWWAFDEARWIGRLRVPERFDLMDVDGDRLLGVWKDDLDIETVRIIRMR